MRPFELRVWGRRTDRLSDAVSDHRGGRGPSWYGGVMCRHFVLWNFESAFTQSRDGRDPRRDGMTGCTLSPMQLEEQVSVVGMAMCILNPIS